MSSSAALFAMSQEGHFRRMVPLISGLAARGVEPHVFTHLSFRDDVERAGGRFVDLFSENPLEEADNKSAPYPCRFVSFAGRYAEHVCRKVERIRPAVVVNDTFAVIGRVVAGMLGLPDVNVCAGHNIDPARLETLLESVPRVAVSPECERWAELLRERHGLKDASPWSWMSTVSEHLNVYCEPTAYLEAAEREVFAPVAFHGSLPSAEEIEARTRGNGHEPFGGAGDLRVYVSFGTVVWRYWPEQALSAMRVISAALAERPEVRAVMSLGRAQLAAEVKRELTAPNVAVADYVDQWRVLAGADVYVTHHGLNSTHEAIWSNVPMVSYPFLWDQPGLAAKCHELGVAVPLAGAPRAPIATDDVHAALERVAGEEDALRSALATAGRWERQVMAERPAVVDRIVALGAA